MIDSSRFFSVRTLFIALATALTSTASPAMAASGFAINVLAPPYIYSEKLNASPASGTGTVAIDLAANGATIAGPYVRVYSTSNGSAGMIDCVPVADLSNLGDPMAYASSLTVSAGRTYSLSAYNASDCTSAAVPPASSLLNSTPTTVLVPLRQPLYTCDGNQCSYTCTGKAADDVPNINSAINTLGSSGGVVTLAAGTCNLGDSTVVPMSEIAILLQSNVWLKGAGSATNGTGTLLQRSGFFTNQTMIAAGQAATPHSASNIWITDMAIDPGTHTYEMVSNPKAIAKSAKTVSLAAALFNPQPIMVIDPNNNSNTGASLYDLSQPVTKNMVPGAFGPANPNGNLSSVSSSFSANGSFLPSITDKNGTYAFNLNTGTTASIPAGDTLLVVAGYNSSAISFASVDHVQVNNLNMLHGSSINFYSVNDFVLSNSAFTTSDPVENFLYEGGVTASPRTLPAEPASNGLVFNNTFTGGGSIYICADNSVVADNTVNGALLSGISGGDCGYYTETVNGQQVIVPAAENVVYQGNIVRNQPSSLTLTTAKGSLVFYGGWDSLMNEAMQIKNLDSSIIDNIVHTNGGEGIGSSANNNVIARNIVYDNAESSAANSGSTQTGGIFLQGVGDVTNPTATNNIITKNTSCNTNGDNPIEASPNCVSGSGSQAYAFLIKDDVGGPVDLSTNFANLFSTGSQIGNCLDYFSSTQSCVTSPNPSAIEVTDPTADLVDGDFPQGTLSVTGCALDGGSHCTAYLSWQSSNATTSVYVRNTSGGLCNIQLLATGSTGSDVSLPWIGNSAYIFTLEDAQGHILDSATLEPTGFSTLAAASAVPTMASCPGNMGY